MSQSQPPAADAIGRLAQELSKLPGIGPKSAQRIAFHLMRAPQEQTGLLADAITAVKRDIKLCSGCCNVSGTDPCPICRSDRRDRSTICVVEQPQDILAIEHTGSYRGLYHVLHGAISPAEGVGANDVRIRELTERLHDGQVTEIILATNTNVEGEQTALYLNHVLTPRGIKITRLARGLPFGTEIEYADDNTLTRAMEGRHEL